MLTRSHIVRGPVVCSAHECSQQGRWLLDWSRIGLCVCGVSRTSVGGTRANTTPCAALRLDLRRNEQQQQQGCPSCRGSGSSVASQVLTLVGDLAGEARRQPGGLQEQRVGPMMGDTHYGVAARRTGPLSVTSLRRRATHAPAGSRVRTERYDGLYYI